MAEELQDIIPPDPLIDEIRAIRKDISNRFGNDVGKLCDYLREEQEKHPEKLAPRKPPRPEKKPE